MLCVVLSGLPVHTVCHIWGIVRPIWRPVHPMGGPVRPIWGPVHPMGGPVHPIWGPVRPMGPCIFRPFQFPFR